MPSIFTKIINREIPAHIVAESDEYIAFLDINPLSKGHTLVVPKKEVDYIFDHADQDLAALFVFSKKVAKAIERSVQCVRVSIAVVGLEVPHTHVHLIPLNTMQDFNFAKQKLKLSQEELQEIASRIKENFE